MNMTMKIPVAVRAEIGRQARERAGAAPEMLLPEDKEEFAARFPAEHQVEGEEVWNATVDRDAERSQAVERQRRASGVSVNGPEQQGFKVLYLSLEQVAVRWGVCRKTVWRYVQAGRLRSWRIGGIRRIPRADVEALEAQGMQEAV